MRILFFSLYFQYKGSETYYTSEVNSVVKNYPNVEFIVYSINSEKKRTLKYSNNVLWIQRKSLKNISTIILFLKDMIKIFTKFKPNVIHSVYVIESLIMGVVGKVFRTPSILHGRGMDLNYYPFISLKSNLIAGLAKLNNAIITVSKNMKNDCIRLNIPKEKIIPIYDGIDLTDFKIGNKVKYDGKRKFEILHIGRFSSEKRHNLIIKTFMKLREIDINIHLTFVGIGPLLEEIKESVNEKGLVNDITFTGWINHNEIPRLMNKADLFILPSLTEGMPISVLEALSMELPVILTNVGGMPELLKETEGILIDKNNDDQLFEAILYYYKNQEIIKKRGKINKEFIINNFNWDTHAKTLYSLYFKLDKKKIL